MAGALDGAGYRVVSGGTDTHLALVDVFAKGVRGKEAEKSLDEAHITVNKNGIPFDVNPPMNPSGVRLGSPAVTTRGFGEKEMRIVGNLIAETLDAVAAKGLDGSGPAIDSVRGKVKRLTEEFPLYAWKLATASV